MKLFVCLGEKNGMTFFGKRVSRDEKIILKMLEIANNEPICMSENTAKLFDGISGNIVVGSTVDGYYFAESNDILNQIENIEKIYIFRFNREYPFDKSFDFDLSGFGLVNTVEFAGKSHEKITMEEWTR